MIEITVGDCGCSVSQHRASPLTVTMNYCPKHAAANELYAALILYRDMFDEDDFEACGCLTCVAARKAVALADGKEVE